MHASATSGRIQRTVASTRRQAQGLKQGSCSAHFAVKACQTHLAPGQQGQRHGGRLALSLEHHGRRSLQRTALVKVCRLGICQGACSCQHDCLQLAHHSGSDGAGVPAARARPRLKQQKGCWLLLPAAGTCCWLQQHAPGTRRPEPGLTATADYRTAHSGAGTCRTRSTVDPSLAMVGAGGPPVMPPSCCVSLCSSSRAAAANLQSCALAQIAADCKPYTRCACRQAFLLLRQPVQLLARCCRQPAVTCSGSD